MATLPNYDTYGGFLTQTIIDQTPEDSEFIRQFYKLLMAYYKSNGLYNYINEELTATGDTDGDLKPLRNPAWRVTEFYASKLFPGPLAKALPIESKTPDVAEAIQKIWRWSNFQSKKQMWARWFAIFGDWFIKIETKKDVDDNVTAVYQHLIRPEYVKSFTTDERGYLTYIRIDVPFLNDAGDPVTYTEIWSKEKGTVEIWESHEEGMEGKTADLGPATSTSNIIDLFGDNFIPIVYQSFRDDGDGRCSGAFTAQLEKIDEVNRQATRLAAMLFRYNRALWVATTSGKDKDGRPLPPVDFSGGLDADSNYQFEEDDLITLPAMSDLKSLVPNINYSDALEIINAQVDEITKDLPELAYYELKGTNYSGRAIRFLLDDMISRVEEVRGNAESALVRANEMAMTVGKGLGLLPDLKATYEDGGFDHSFAQRPVLPQDLEEIIGNIKTLSDAGVAVYPAAKASGMSEAQAADLAQVDVFGEEGKAEPGDRIDGGEPTV